MITALKTCTKEGKRFYIPCGFSKAEKINPPSIGAIIEYTHAGFCEDSGKPIHPAFSKERPDIPQQSIPLAEPFQPSIL